MLPFIFALIIGQLVVVIVRSFSETPRANIPANDPQIDKPVPRSKKPRANIPANSLRIDRAVLQILKKIAYICVLILLFIPVGLVLIFLSIRGYFIHRYKRQAAQNLETEPEQLRKLAEVRDRTTLLKIASNPNTPPEVLLKLGEKFPKELLANPVFDLMLLEDANLLVTMPRNTLKSILAVEDIPVGFLERSAAIPNLGSAAAVIAEHPKATEHMFEQIAQYSNDPRVIRSLIERSSLSDTILKKIAAHGTGGMKQYLAKRSEFPQDALEKIVQNTLAMHLVQPSHNFVALLEALAQEGIPEIQLYLVQQPNLPVSVLEALAEKGGEQVQLILMQRPHLPVTVLEKLEREGSEQVRACLAQQTDLPLHLLKRLSYSIHSPIRELIVQHPHVSLELLQDLARDDNAQVRKLALQRLAQQQDKRERS